MADRTVRYILDVDYAGQSVTLRAQQDLREVNDSAKDASRGLKEAGESASHAQRGMDLLKGAVAGLGISLGAQGLASAARAAYDALKEGAGLDAAKQKFDNLAASIGTTGEALQGALVEATGGMLSNAQLIAGATDLMALGLAKNSDEAIRLSTLVGKLGWDMQVLGLTIANQSTARLDSLSLSMEVVKEKAKALEEQGYSTAEAFKLAVIESGEANLRLYGDTAETTAGKLAKVEATLQNVADAAKVAFAEGIAEHVDEIAEAAEAAGPALVTMASGLATLIGYVDEIEKLAAFMQMLQGQPQMYQAIQAREALQAELDKREELAEMTEAGRERVQQAARDQVDAVQRTTAATEEAAAATRRWGSDASYTADMLERMAERESGFSNLDAIRDERRRANEEYRAQIEEQKQAFVEAVNEQADALREMYDEAAARGGDIFMQQLDLPAADQLFNADGVANAEALRDAILGAADAAGAGAPQLADLTTEMGLLGDEAAELKVKAAIFDEALGILTKQWKLGELDTSEFLGAVDEVISELENKSLPQLTMEIAPPEIPSWDQWRIPGGSHGAAQKLQIEADITPVESAIKTALELVGGAPIDERTLVVEWNGDAVDTGISVASALVGDFVAGEYLATVELNYDSVETGMTRVNTLLADLPEYKQVHLDFTSNIDDILQQLREAGVVQ